MLGFCAVRVSDAPQQRHLYIHPSPPNLLYLRTRVTRAPPRPKPHLAGLVPTTALLILILIEFCRRRSRDVFDELEEDGDPFANSSTSSSALYNQSPSSQRSPMPSPKASPRGAPPPRDDYACTTSNTAYGDAYGSTESAYSKPLPARPAPTGETALAGAQMIPVMILTEHSSECALISSDLAHSHRCAAVESQLEAAASSGQVHSRRQRSGVSL